MPNGRAYVPTPKDREYVRAMYGVVGLTIEQIAAVMRVTERTIRNHYRDDLSGARAAAAAQVAGALFKTATSKPGTPGQVDAAKFWLQTRARWSTTNILEIRAEVASGISPVLADLRLLPTENLRALEEIAGILDVQSEEVSSAPLSEEERDAKAYEVLAAGEFASDTTEG